MKHKMTMEPNELLGGRYRIRARIGQGGSGVVYVAEDLRLQGRRWAVKAVRHLPQEGNPLIREVEMLTRLDHPCLPRIVDYFPPKDGGYGYLVTDFIDGSTLLERFAAEGKRMSTAEVLRIVLQLCRCFRYLHGLREPIIYRDLKPANVMVNAQGRVYLIDFGIARSYKRGHLADTVALGTAAFAAPEQLEGRQTDARTDLYGLGALMYYLLSGGLYYYAERRSLKRLRPDLSATLIAMVDKLLQFDPAKRFPSAASLERALMAERGAQTMVEHDATHRANSTLHSSSHAAQRSRLVLIGNLFPGAGASFAAIALARVLNRIGIPHALTEYPGTEPELYDVLDGNRRCPPRYSFLSERRLETSANADSKQEWKSGKTVWYPLNPRKPGDAQQLRHDGQWRAWLDAFSEPLNIIDLSNGWELPYVESLCMRADLIIWVADPHPGKFNSLAARKRIEQAMKWRERGKQAHFIANKVSGKQKDWIQSFPWAPLCTLPAAAWTEWWDDYHSGKLVQDRKHMLQRHLQALWPLLHQMKIPFVDKR